MNNLIKLEYDMSADRIKTLLIEDNPGDARLIQEFLTDTDANKFHITHVTRLSEAMESFSEGLFDVALLDLSLPDSQGLETFEEFYKHASSVPVVILTGLDDETIAVRAVDAGAQDYLVKGTVDAKSLARSIRYAIQRHHVLVDECTKAQKKLTGRVIGFVGAKGGVGTTTVAVNIAAVIAEQKGSVIAVEFRPNHGTFSQHMGMRQALASNWGGLFELAPEHIDERELSKWLRTTQFGLKVLLGPQKVEEFKEVENGQAEAVINGLVNLADCTIVDLPCSPSNANQTVIQFCDLVTLIVEPKIDSIMSGKVHMELLRSWGLRKTQIRLVVVNRTNLSSPLNLEAIGSYLDCKVVGKVPADPDAFDMSLRSGSPIVISNPDSEPAMSLRKIASKLIEDSLFSVRA